MSACMWADTPGPQCPADDLRAEVERLTRERDALASALADLVAYENKRHPPKMGGGQLPPSLRKLVAIADAALASVPAPVAADARQPMPDKGWDPAAQAMAVAERVREACARALEIDYSYMQNQHAAATEAAKCVRESAVIDLSALVKGAAK